MAKSEDNPKQMKLKGKIKKEKKALKKIAKDLKGREKELDKWEKKLKKQEKKLKKREKEFDSVTKFKIDKSAEGNNVSEGTSLHEEIQPSGRQKTRDASIKTRNRQSQIPISERRPVKLGESSMVTAKSTVSGRKRKNEVKESTTSPAPPTESGKENISVNKSSEVPVRKGFSIISNIDSVEKVKAFIEGDERKTIQDAGEKRIRNLEK